MSDSLDVLVITQFFPPESMGGAHRWEKLSANLNEEIEPHILTTQPTFPFGKFERRFRPLEQESVSGVTATRLFTYQPTSDTILGRLLNYGMFSILSTLYVLGTFWRYDCVVTMSAPHTTFVPGLTGKMLGLRWYLDIFDLWVDNAADLGYVDEDSLAYEIVAALERVSFEQSNGVFVITDTMAEYYKKKYDGAEFAVHVVPFGVDTDLFSPDVEPTASPDVIYTGNLGTGQAFEPFFRGFAEVDGEPELLIVGRGERQQELERLARRLGIDDRVTFEGYVSRSDVPHLVAGATVSFVPLKTEHQLDYARPTKLLETMAVGTPYIASEVNEIADLSHCHEPGIAVKNESGVVAEALETLLSSPDARDEMGKNGLEVIRSSHDWDVIGASVSSFIRATASA